MSRPPSNQKRATVLEVRVTELEREAFKDAAALAGIPLSAWVRERLRRLAIRELEAANRPVAFLHSPRGASGDTE